MTDRKFGRKPPKNAPALKLGPLLTGTVPPHPATADNFTALNGGWAMLGNDTYGDCVSVTGANFRRVMTGGRYPSLDQVIAFYKTQNPGFPSQDDGMNIQTALETLHSDGDKYFDGAKVVAFAKVDHTNPDEVKAAVAIFGAVWVGINVLQANMTEFDAGQPWDYIAGSPLDGGHSVLVGGYDSDNTGGDERFITWAQETSFTDAFWSHQVEEAWVVIWPEHLGTIQFQQGIDTQALAAAYQQLTGKTLPLPTPPAPAPTPTPPAPPSPPSPAPDADEVLAQAVVASGFLTHRHIGANRVVADALRAWMTARG